MIFPINLSIQSISLITAFIGTIIMGPILIPVLRRLKFGQTVRDDGPGTHLVKMGTPTIGGMIFLIPVLVLSIVYAFFDTRIIPLLFATFGFGAIGFIDDFIKVVKKRKDGLYAKQKMLGLLLIAAIFSVYVVNAGIGTSIYVPFPGFNTWIDLGWFFIPFAILVLISVTNAVNITDGLDGLAASVTLIIIIFFSMVAITDYDWQYVKVFSSLIAGGCLGFLAFNLYPAKVFMGDTGALALGGAVGSIAIVMKLPLILLIVGGIYIIETLSVMLQVSSFKLLGRRIFKMAPIHHHFELLGWKEGWVVALFCFCTIVLCFIGFMALRIKLV